MQPTPTWAASSSSPRATRRPGGEARLGSRICGKQPSQIAHAGADAPTMLAGRRAPATTWPTTTPGVAAEWDWEANGERTPETVTASSNLRAAWTCGLCGHRWSAKVGDRTRIIQGTGCPQCWREAGRHKTLQPSISNGAPHLLADWDWEANERCCWRPDQVTLGSNKKVHWRRLDECKLGLVHRWQAMPIQRVHCITGSPFPFGRALCACNSLAVQCPEAADLWNSPLNGGLTPHQVTWQSNQKVFWKAPDGRQWHQKVSQVVSFLRTHQAKSIE